MSKPEIEKPIQEEGKKKETPLPQEQEKVSELHDPGEYYLKKED